MNELNAIATDQIVPPLEKAVWWIEYVLRHDGAKHLMYSGRNTPFYQFYMLDILAFFVFALMLISVVSVMSIRATMTFFNFSRNYVQNKMKKKIQ